MNNKIKVMCLGDSITEGFTVDGAYRNRLCEMIEQDGLKDKVVFVGSHSNGTGYDGHNEGHSGFAVARVPQNEDCEGNGRDGLLENLDKWMGNNVADIVLVQAGTNDIIALYRLDEFKDRLNALLDKVRKHLSENGVIFLATIQNFSEKSKFNLTGKNQEELYALINNLNDNIRSIAAENEDIILADLNGLLDFSELQDGVHPHKEGYKKLGEEWYKIIKDKFII